MVNVPRSWQIMAWRAFFTSLPRDPRNGPPRFTKVEFKSGRQLYLVKEGGQLINVDKARKAGKL